MGRERGSCFIPIPYLNKKLCKKLSLYPLRENPDILIALEISACILYHLKKNQEEKGEKKLRTARPFSSF